MPTDQSIIIPVRMSRDFVKQHPDWYFLYGQDSFEKGCLGQSWQLANEPNTFPIFTLYKVCQSASDKYFSDKDPYHRTLIDRSISLVPRDKPIVPLHKIGRGHSQLYILAPRLYAYMQQELNKIKSPNITIDWITPFK